MQCAYCGMANPAQARFCLHCGQALVRGVVCRTCFTLLPHHARFCFHCGTIVIATAQAASATSNVQTDFQPATAVQMGSAAHAFAPEVDAASGAASPLQHSPEALIIGRLPTPRPFYDMLDSLRRYLPPSLYEPMERRPTERQLDQVRDHLRKLLATTRTYLPQPVFLNPQPPGEPAGAMQRGVFLFVDVSGFTPLSEQLRRFGNLGAERITTIINDLFSELVTILFNHGGVLLKYGGDALLGLWEAASDEDMSGGALLAVQAAWAMQNIMQKFASIDAAGENYTLRVKIGISAGPYFAAHIGTKNNMAYITTGHTVNRAEEAQGNAAPGDIIITQSTRDWLDQRAQIESVEAEGYFIVRGVEPLGHSLRVQTGDELADGSVRAQITYLVERMDRLSPYLPEELIARIVTNPEDTSLSPDHRPVTIIFANYVGLSNLIEDLGSSEPGVITYQLNRYFTRMAEIVERYEGTLARMDQYAVGDRLIIFFGAPKAHEDDPVRAVYTALEIQRTTRDDFSALKSSKGIYRFQQRIGINTGYVFAGNIGAPDLRQEYTLMGDDINTAARLMAKAPWQSILISKKTHQRVANFFETKDWGELKVKGKTIAIPTYEVLDYRDETAPELEFGSSTPLIGRDEAAKKLLQAGQGFLKERGQILFIMGEGGMGKSRTLRILRDWLYEQKAAEKLRWLEVQALSFSEQISYWLARRMLLAALNLAEDTRSDDILFALWDKGEKLLGKETAREATPFLAYMMNLPLEGAWAEWIHELDPEVRQKQTFWAAREFFTALAKEQPIIMVVDELHWGDEPSLALLENLLEMAIHVPLLFIFVFRPKREKGCWRLRERAARDYHSRCTEIELLPLTQQQSGELLAQLLPGAVFTSEAQADIF